MVWNRSHWSLLMALLPRDLDPDKWWKMDDDFSFPLPPLLQSTPVIQTSPPQLFGSPPAPPSFFSPTSSFCSPSPPICPHPSPPVIISSSPPPVSVSPPPALHHLRPFFYLLAMAFSACWPLSSSLVWSHQVFSGLFWSSLVWSRLTGLITIKTIIIFSLTHK